MPPESLLRLLAGSLTTLAFLPQVVKTWRSRQTRDLSPLGEANAALDRLRRGEMRGASVLLP